MEFKIQDEDKVLEVETYGKDELHLLISNKDNDFLGEIIDRHCHHESARRGAKTGTQGKKGSYNRSKIPNELCKEIIESTKVVL